MGTRAESINKPNVRLHESSLALDVPCCDEKAVMVFNDFIDEHVSGQPDTEDSLRVIRGKKNEFNDFMREHGVPYEIQTGWADSLVSRTLATKNLFWTYCLVKKKDNA
jgi:hypothetical protein